MEDVCCGEEDAEDAQLEEEAGDGHPLPCFGLLLLEARTWKMSMSANFSYAKSDVEPTGRTVPLDVYCHQIAKYKEPGQPPSSDGAHMLGSNHRHDPPQHHVDRS